MPYANIDAAISDSTIQEIEAAIASIEANLPFLVLLTADERRKLYKMGDKSVAFVQDALSGARNFPKAIPGTIDVAAAERDFTLSKQLGELELLLSALLAKVSDTRVAAGSEAMSSSTQIYQQFKTSGRTEPGLKVVAERLGARWKQAATDEEPPAGDK